MHENFDGGFNCLVAGMIAFARSLNPVIKRFDLFIAWPFSWVLHSTPTRNQHWKRRIWNLQKSTHKAKCTL